MAFHLMQYFQSAYQLLISFSFVNFISVILYKKNNYQYCILCHLSKAYILHIDQHYPEFMNPHH